MSSGQERMVFNTRERVISPDSNRLQDFLALGLAEQARALFDISYGTDDLDAGAVASETASSTDPLTAEILYGLMVQPQAGSNSVLVSAGAGFFLAPDGGADDSNYKWASSEGEQTLGQLLIPSNAGGSPQISIVECSWSAITTETDNRDIYDPSTDTFSATLVTKVRAGALTFRVRTGTVGGGFASVLTASGWLPLAIASMPAGGSDCDDATFWDVRALVSDRQFGSTKMTHDLPKNLGQFGATVFDTGVASFYGVFEKTINGRRYGGRIRPGVPLTDANFIDLMDTANVANGQVPGNNVYWYVWLLAPFGLPRWARYTDGPSGRVPRSPRGIPVVSSVDPDKKGSPTAAVALPTSTGLGGSTSDAALVACGRTDGSGTITGTVMDGKEQAFHTNFVTINAGTSGILSGAWTLTDNTDFPASARAIRARINVSRQVADGTEEHFENVRIQLYDAAGNFCGQVPLNSQFFVNKTGGLQVYLISWEARIPIVSEYPTTTPGTRTLQVVWENAASGAFNTYTIEVMGVELGD